MGTGAHSDSVRADQPGRAVCQSFGRRTGGDAGAAGWRKPCPGSKSDEPDDSLRSDPRARTLLHEIRAKGTKVRLERRLTAADDPGENEGTTGDARGKRYKDSHEDEID